VGRNLASETYRKYEQLFRQLEAFARDKGLRFVDQLDLHVLTAFRSTWKDAPLSASRKLTRLRAVLGFGLRRKWIRENPASDLPMPRIKYAPTLPFDEDEMKRILEAATKPRDRAFVLVMRHAGLRLSDAATLSRASVDGSRIRLYQAKTGEPVFVPVPSEVVQALAALPCKGEFYFQTGHAKVQSSASVWRKRLAAVFRKANVEDGHSHRFRDTFACVLLSKGVSLESVSRLLGHSSVRVTEQHYAPWVRSRQDALEAEVLAALR
jgi:integrase